MKKYKKISIFIATCLLLVVIFFAIALFPGTASPGFQEYKPSVLPSGLKVTGSELLIERYRRQFWPKFNKYLNINLNQPNSWINEGKSDGIGFYNNWCQQYNAGADCKGYHTNGGQNYLVSTVTNTSHELDQDVYFIKGGTSIEVILTNYHAISRQEWDKMVDGFQPTHYPHSKITRSSAEGP